jgi:hypothetical protein
VVASGEGVIVTIGGGSIEPALRAASEAAGCGEWGVGGALDLLLPLMQQGEEAELWCGPAFIGGPHSRVDVWARLRRWTRVEEVPETAGLVVRRVVREAGEQYERPGEDAVCTVRFTVRREAGGEDTEGGKEDAEGGAGGEEDTEGGPAWEAAGDTGGGGAVLESTGAEPREWILGDGRLLPCIDAALREMKRGEVARLTAPPAWAYAPPGGGVALPPALTAGSAAEVGVVVLLELVKFVRAKEAWEMSVAEKAASQLRRKGQGNAAFARGQYERAVRMYEAANTRAPTEADFDKEEKGEGKGEGGREKGEVGESVGGDAGVGGADRASVASTKLACFVNLAACHLKLGAPSAAETVCTSALEISPTHAKALFRRGQARMAMAEFGLAKADLTAAARADPTAREPRKALAELQAAVDKAKRDEKSAFGGIFKK